MKNRYGNNGQVHACYSDVWQFDARQLVFFKFNCIQKWSCKQADFTLSFSHFNFLVHFELGTKMRAVITLVGFKSFLVKLLNIW